MDIIFLYTLYSIQVDNFREWPALYVETKHPDKAIGPDNYDFFEWMIPITTPKPDYFSRN